MMNYGNISIGETGTKVDALISGRKIRVEGKDEAGNATTDYSSPVDANISRMVTTTFGHNLSEGNDFTVAIPVNLQVPGGDAHKAIHVQPDDVDDLRELAQRALAHGGQLSIYNRDQDGPIGTIDPKTLLATLPKR